MIEEGNTIMGPAYNLKMKQAFEKWQSLQERENIVVNLIKEGNSVYAFGEDALILGQIKKDFDLDGIEMGTGMAVFHYCLLSTIVNYLWNRGIAVCADLK